MAKWRVFSFLILFGCASTSHQPHPGGVDAPAPDPENATTIIEGGISGHDGEPPAFAEVRLQAGPDDPPIQVVVADDGKFELASNHRGIVRLEVSAADHAAARFLVVLDGQPIDLSVKLGTHPRAEPLEELLLIYWEGDPGDQPAMAPFAKEKNGTWTAEVASKAQSVRYQVVGLAEPGRAVNGPGAESYEYDGEGDYISVRAVKDGKLRINVDPTALATPAAPLSVAFADSDRPSARLFKALDGENPMAGLDAEQSADVRRGIISEYLRHAVQVANATDHDRELAAELLGEMPASDAGWALFPDVMVKAVKLSTKPEHAKRFEALIDEELPPSLAAGLLYQRLIEASADGDVQKTRELFTRLQRPKRFGDSEFLQVAKAYDPDGGLGPGKPLPAFEVGALLRKGRRARQITNEDLRGKVHLIDLWGTYCDPCLDEMENLHAVYEKHAKVRGFEILSIAVDDDAATIEAFRAQAFPMPWSHALASFDKIEETFGVVMLPFAILVDENGKILASGARLNGATLDAALTEHLR